MDNTDQHRHECECREWLSRIRAKKPRTAIEGENMLDDLIKDITKIRGKTAGERLRAGVEAARLAKG